MNKANTASAPRREPANRQDWIALLRTLGIKPSRAMGQNFLVEPEIVRHIADVSGVNSGSRVIEVGPGLGILTRELLRRNCTVTGVELDDELATYLENDLRDDTRFDLVRKDARHVDVAAITAGQPYQVVANLPYSVATVIIRHFVESENPPTSLTIMVQREVAERMTATPPDMSLLGLATRLYTDASIQFIVPPDSFLPPPKVESAVLTLDVRVDTGMNQFERDRLFELATMSFQRKRKTIANGLSQGLGLDKSEIEARLTDAGIDVMRRPQTLDLDDWIRLTRAIPA
jgi:16S rRNA (adenine1518-N6/adenine1519-N6)-dimethyltransferase